MIQPRPATRTRRLVNILGPFLGLLLVIGFVLAQPHRPSLLPHRRKLKIILTQTVIVAVGTLGMTLIIVSGGIDLSVGSTVALTSVLGATALMKGYSPLAALAMTILLGGLVGLVNGLAVGGLRMMPFIVTLGMMGVARGSAKWLSGSQTITPPETWINNIMELKEPTQLLPFPIGVWIALGLAMLMALVMRRTVFGRYIFAIGSNEAVTRLCGIRVGLQKAVIYSLAGLFFGMAGLMQLSRLTQGDPTVAIGLELDIIAAGSDRRGQPERGHRQHSWLNDRRVNHGRASQRDESNGLAHLCAGDHHRHRHHHRGRSGQTSTGKHETVSRSQGRFKNAQYRSRRRQSAHFF